MPKREKTPSPSPDESKYLTIVHPWPGHLDLSLPGDGKRMCKWLAAACGTSDPIMSFFFRPDSPGLCIIEIVKDWAEQHVVRLLGCHSWHEFLRDKSDTANNDTCVFYSCYASQREVQKKGWKRVDLDDSWFGSSEERKRTFVSPYPRSTWCPLPAYDATGHSFCRALPVNLFPEGNPTNAPVVPVGSQAWIAKKAATPAHITPLGSRSTPELLISPTDDEDWGPTGSIVESNEPTVVTEDLWGQSEEDGTTELILISDLPLASFDESVDHKSLCPHHGQTCKKGLCSWRADYEKQKERECGYPKNGPSNTKNYNRRPNNREYSSGGNRDGTPTGIRGPARGRPRGTPPPHVPGQGNGTGRGGPRPPAWGAPNRTNQPSTSAPNQGNGTGRGGQPAWAPVRGRK